MPGETQEIRQLNQSAEAGGDWYIGPESLDAGEFTYTLALALFGDDSWTAYDITFEWDGRSAHANVVANISDDEGLSPASSSPIDGWVAWAGPDLVLAFQWTADYVQGCARLQGRSPFVDDNGQTAGEDETHRWAELAREIAPFLLGDEATS